MDDRSLYHTLAGRYGCGAGNVVGSSSCSTLYSYAPNSFESVALDVPAWQPSTASRKSLLG